jgi:hypothetical protein
VAGSSDIPLCGICTLSALALGAGMGNLVARISTRRHDAAEARSLPALEGCHDHAETPVTIGLERPTAWVLVNSVARRHPVHQAVVGHFVAVGGQACDRGLRFKASAVVFVAFGTWIGIDLVACSCAWGRILPSVTALIQVGVMWILVHVVPLG